ncbi:MAG: hypothetical protein H7X91_01585 [Burkholderiales bacterium]|nr:hypothetical protein [Burkholderiales bacterium]
MKDVYGTNLFPFIKPNGMKTKIPHKLLVEAAKEFAVPQIQIVRPKLVVCLGIPTFNAVRQFCLGPISKLDLRSAIDSPFDFEGIRVWCQAHTGQFIWRNGGGRDRVKKDWLKMKAYLDGYRGS